MSDDQLDNDLRDRIKQVFDDYHDDTAKEGWLLLREKYPEKKKERAIFWWRMVGVAAFWLLMLNIVLWYRNDKISPKKIAGNHKIERVGSVATEVTRTKPIHQDSSSGQVKIQKTGISSVAIAGKQMPVTGISSVGTHIIQPPVSSHYQPSILVDSGSKLVAATTQSTITQPYTLIDSGKTTLGKDNQFPADKKVNVASQQQAVVVSKSMQQLFDKEDKAKKNTDEQQTTAAKVVFGIYSASYVNYAKGSQRQFNNGAGLSSDIKLTANLSISTGIAIGQNSLAYNTTQPPSLQTAALFTKNSKNFLPSASMLPLLVPTSQNLNASLVNLDIPVNLKYNFNPQTNRTYIVAGLSSGTFINENYNTTYSYNGPGGSTLQQSQDASHKTFDNFYFAQMLNLAMGVGYPLGKNQLVIEPFFKYPLSGLGDQHILFGSAGLNLKFNFDSAKPKK